MDCIDENDDKYAHKKEVFSVKEFYYDVEQNHIKERNPVMDC